MNERALAGPPRALVAAFLMVSSGAFACAGPAPASETEAAAVAVTVTEAVAETVAVAVTEAVAEAVAVTVAETAAAAVAAAAADNAGDPGGAGRAQRGDVKSGPSSSFIDSFLGRARTVRVERLAPPSRVAQGASGAQSAQSAQDAQRTSERDPAPVLLHYDDRGLTAPALIGRHAIVKMEGLTDAEIPDYLGALGVRPVRPLMPSIGLWLVEDAAEEDGLAVASRLAPHLLQGDPGKPMRGLRRAVPDLYLGHRLHGEPFSPNDPRFPGQWFFDNLNMQEAWGLTLGDPKTSVVIVDSGCDLGHKDLSAKMDPGKDVYDNDNDPSFAPGMQDNAHGTACAGLVAAATDNDEGIAGGCPECRMRCVRLLGGEMVPVSADVDAFNFALETGAAIVSNSWGFSEPIPVPGALEDAINNVFDNGRGGLGALVLFAVGNDDRKVNDDELQAVRGVLGIGAVNNFDEETVFTNYGNAVDLVAPTGTLSTDISGSDGYGGEDYTSSFGGTSSACPVAAGVAGLVVSAAPDKTSAEIYEVLLRTARPAPFALPDEKGHDPLFGYGIIDPTAALRDVLGIQEFPDAGPDSGPPPVVEDEGDDTPSGCACSMKGAPPSPVSAVLAAGAIALGYARSRRRRRPC